MLGCDVCQGGKQNGYLAVNLSLTDLFWTNNWDNYSSFEGFHLWNWGKGESRQIKLNISYRFGKEKSRTHKQDFNELDRLQFTKHH